MLNKGIFKKIRSAASNISYVTLSGEINISPKDLSCLVVNDSELYAEIKNHVLKFKSLYPRFKVETVHGMYEISIKIFAFRKIIMEENFLDTLQFVLTNLIKEINNEKDLKIILNLYGYISSLSTSENFRYLNNNEEVKYKITATTIRDTILSKLKFLFNIKSDM